MHEPIQTLLDDKGSDIYSISPEATVLAAVEEMNDKGVGAVLVMEDDRLLGIFTERDVLRRVVAQQRDAKTTRVADVMTDELVVIKPTITVEDAMAVVTEKRCRHLPVIENGKVVGLLSIGDLTHWVSRDHEVQIQQMVEYVTGQYPA